MLFRGCQKSSKLMFILSFALSFLAVVLSVLSMFFPILKGAFYFLPLGLVSVAVLLFVIPLSLELSKSNKRPTTKQTDSSNGNAKE